MDEAEFRRTLGWSVIWGFVVAHNVWAAGTHHEMLSQTARRKCKEHPIVIPVFALSLVAHLMGWLGPGDPLYRLGEQVERIFRKWSAVQ